MTANLMAVGNGARVHHFTSEIIVRTSRNQKIASMGVASSKHVGEKGEDPLIAKCD